MIRVAINGFGRIGRQVFQAGFRDTTIEWVAVNDLTDTKTLAYLLKHDSIYGRFPGTVDAMPDSLVVDNKHIRVFAEKDPSKLPWKDLRIDVVIESTGFFTHREGAQLHLTAGAKKVLISAPAKNPDFSIVKGVNDGSYDKKKHHIVSNCSCTTNAAAPLAKVLNDNFRITTSMLVTAHAYTATQKLVDAADPKDLRRGRHAAINIIPTTTGAADSVIDVIPDLKGKIDGYAWRVPVPVGSIVSVIATVEKPTTVEQINWLFSEVSKYHMKNVLRYETEPIVLTDIVRDPYSVVFDSPSTKIVQGRLVTVSGWYDNEWGFSHRMIDVLKIL